MGSRRGRRDVSVDKGRIDRKLTGPFALAVAAAAAAAAVAAAVAVGRQLKIRSALLYARERCEGVDPRVDCADT